MIHIFSIINRALELAIRHKRLLDEVLHERKKYLVILNKEENNQSFLALNASKLKPRQSSASREAKFMEKEDKSELSEMEKLVISSTPEVPVTPNSSS